MTEKKIIAVVGATGSQGGGLARAILDDWNGPFTARALTRNPDSPVAASRWCGPTSTTRPACARPSWRPRSSTRCSSTRG
ncbi:NmrA family NAD(P)-binding protein [Nonomuraea fuscirosea]|uniref:NmrA family NAD(P)-binding protein n=1 Tax=Nonomuraea fuscirosea TaxID=1291556 RepID=UPI00343A9688